MLSTPFALPICTEALNSIAFRSIDSAASTLYLLATKNRLHVASTSPIGHMFGGTVVFVFRRFSNTSLTRSRQSEGCGYSWNNFVGSTTSPSPSASAEEDPMAHDAAEDAALERELNMTTWRVCVVSFAFFHLEQSANSFFVPFRRRRVSSDWFISPLIMISNKRETTTFKKIEL